MGDNIHFSYLFCYLFCDSNFCSLDAAKNNASIFCDLLLCICEADIIRSCEW